MIKIIYVKAQHFDITQTTDEVRSILKLQKQQF